MQIESGDRKEVIIGVVSDTHISDQVAELHPDLLKGLKDAGVQLILHAGDVSSKPPLELLREIAPVEAVAGNRDMFYGMGLPAEKRFTINGVEIFLSHGHGTIGIYLWDKWIYMLSGYEFSRYCRYLQKVAGQADVVVFGHTHRAENRTVNGVLFFNPGSSGPNYIRSTPSFGILRIDVEGKINGEIHYLENYPVRNKHWVTA